ncbi:MAG: polyphenol oxidase family protein, partial [Sulfurimonas sp.]|nr:polyphenol oxidase family protein [Sulfurimonas sp.]
SIGPSIGECCYEVGEEIYHEAKSLDLDYALNLKANTYYLSISKILHKQLLDNGLEDKNIEFSKECTVCKTQKYFSYREQGETGRFCGLLMLN